MKKTGMAFVAAVLLMSAGCRKNSTTDVGTYAGSSTSSMQAQVNGSNWKAVSPGARKGTLTNAITVTGVAADGTTMIISINNKNPASYSLGSAYPNSASYAVTGSLYSTAVAGTGTVKLISIDEIAKKVSGTFSFTAIVGTDVKTISAGSFQDILYTEQTDTLPGTGGGGTGGGGGGGSTPTGTVSASVDGSAFSASGSSVTVSSFFGIYSITAISGSKSFTFSLSNATNVSTDTQGLINIVRYGEGSDIYTNTAQSVSILSYDNSTKKVVGSFSLTATSNGTTKTITNGSFSFIAN